MNYKIINDGSELNRFIRWLPDLKKSEAYLFLLFARKKYCPEMELRCGHQNMKRFTCNSKDLIIKKIKQLELPIGGYFDKDKVIPQQALALYVNINPRCMIRASKELLKVLADKITRPYEGYNPQNLALTQIHKAKGTGNFIDFDFDCPCADGDKLQKHWMTKQLMAIDKIINPQAVNIIETKNGFHCLVKPSKIDKKYIKTFYNDIKSLGVDVVGDCMVPVPGCVQGDHTPSLF